VKLASRAGDGRFSADMGLFDLFKKKEPELAPSPELAAWIQQLSSADAKVRFQACQAIGKLGARAQPATPKLMELINDDDGDVCNAAAAALSQIERQQSR
jgi:HEAT repeat protein